MFISVDNPYSGKLVFTRFSTIFTHIKRKIKIKKIKEKYYSKRKWEFGNVDFFAYLYRKN